MNGISRRLTTIGASLVAMMAIAVWPIDAPVRAAQPPLTFNRDVAPIVFSSCVTCHQPDGAAPFSLLTYPDVKQRARLIADAIAAHYMPPWQPDSEGAALEGDRRLDPSQIEIVRRWVDEGSAEGDPADLPPLPPLTPGWRLGVPDLVVTMEQPYAVPASGPDVFRNFVLPATLSDRRYVRAIEFRPGNARVLHHVRILLDDTGDVRRRDAKDADAGFPGMEVPGAGFPDGHFLGWVPGKMADREVFPWPLEPGTDFVVQMHLKPTGRPELVQSSIGLYLTDEAPSATPLIVRLGSKTIDIPAGAARYELTDSYAMPIDVSVHSITPHAHYLAKEMTVFAKLPNGTVETLLHIPNWNFNWQDEYEFRRPIVLRKGTTVTMRYTYDNSASNPHNPRQPPQRVRFGPETTDEMGELLLEVLPVKVAELGTIRADVARKNLMTDVAGQEKRVNDVPDDYESRNALGVGYLQLGRRAEAIRQLQDALLIAPAYPATHYNLAVVAMGERRFAEALMHYQQAIAARPDYVEARNNLGVLYELTGRTDLAVEQYTRALEIRPTHVATHNNLGLVLMARGQLADAAAHFRAALRTRPDSGDVLYSLGRLQVAQGRPRDAVQTWRRALVAKPDSVPLLVDMARLLSGSAEVQNSREAVQLAERANKMSGNANPAVLDVLAAAYALEGHFDVAQRIEQRALQRAVATNDAHMVEVIRRRLEVLQQSSSPSAEEP